MAMFISKIMNHHKYKHPIRSILVFNFYEKLYFLLVTDMALLKKIWWLGIGN